LAELVSLFDTGTVVAGVSEGSAADALAEDDFGADDDLSDEEATADDFASDVADDLADDLADELDDGVGVGSSACAVTGTRPNTAVTAATSTTVSRRTCAWRGGRACLPDRRVTGVPLPKCAARQIDQPAREMKAHCEAEVNAWG
jgi:hypothetical protein